MSKAYSNKALPAGTVLREWRLEEVLGVGGFGIVYKGRGIYFDELVAIKEYFPSSISEREADDTVVPIDSDAEEVHALGLKKFVEEAKLLWNLSTPTRHPNIVSVRSLFEIHGTAYMVMDFEDGIALSQMLKRGDKFNERSLWNIIRPVAEGLDRAHRVGVLHRDIKPPNILINEDGRPVLIDFGSARFEAAEATSTKVTFHTPPYAAVEQYVKTYPQGPWTDIYALGVVLYECVTGEKPPEVLERMHGGLGKNLSESSWPGYSKKFLAAIDAAMTIRPQERPQSITQWLDLFGKPAQSKRVAEAADEDATRVFTHELTADEIVPVPPPAAGFPEGEAVETQVPASPNDVVFKGAGQETGAKKKASTSAAALKLAAKNGGKTPEPPVEDLSRGRKPDLAGPQKSTRAGGDKKPSPALVRGAIAAGVVAAIVGGWAMLRGGPEDALPSAPQVASTAGPVALADAGTLSPAIRALADDATKAGAPLTAVTGLTSASEQLAQQFQSLQALVADPAQADVAKQRETEMRQLATGATAQFASSLLQDVQAKAQRLSAAAPWANPTNANAATSQSKDRQQIAALVRTSIQQMQSAVDAAGKATTPSQALDYARLALTQSQNFTTASLAAYKAQETGVAPEVEFARSERPLPTVAAPQKSATKSPAGATAQAAASSATTLTPSKVNLLNGIIDDGRNMAKQVIRMGKEKTSDPSVNQARQANAKLAQSYDANLKALKDSARGVESDRDADRYIAQAKQTSAYIKFLYNQSAKGP